MLVGVKAKTPALEPTVEVPTPVEEPATAPKEETNTTPKQEPAPVAEPTEAPPKVKPAKGGKGEAYEDPYNPRNDPRFEELSTEEGKTSKGDKLKAEKEAEAILQAENEGLVNDPKRPSKSSGEPDLDFKIDGPEPYKYCDVKTPVDPKYRPLSKQAAEVGENITAQKGGSKDVLHIVDMKNVPAADKVSFKANVLKSAGSSDGIEFIND